MNIGTRVGVASLICAGSAAIASAVCCCYITMTVKCNSLLGPGPTPWLTRVCTHIPAEGPPIVTPCPDDVLNNPDRMIAVGTDEEGPPGKKGIVAGMPCNVSWRNRWCSEDNFCSEDPEGPIQMRTGYSVTVDPSSEDCNNG